MSCQAGDGPIVLNWIASNSERFEPAMAETLLLGVRPFTAASIPGDFTEYDYQLGRQAFRGSSRAEQLVCYEEALREGRVDFESGYILWDHDAVQDAGDLGIQELEPLVAASAASLGRDIARHKLAYRAGATSLYDAAQRHLQGLARLRIEVVAESLIQDLAFQISVSDLRNDLCSPVLYSECGAMRDLLSSWAAELEVQPELAGRHPVDEFHRHETVLQLVRSLAEYDPASEACCRETK